MTALLATPPTTSLTVQPDMKDRVDRMIRLVASVGLWLGLLLLVTYW